MIAVNGIINNFEGVRLKKICRICGRGFYTKNRGNRVKYCSSKCAEIANRQKSRKRMNLGTTSQNLSPKSVKKQLNYIKNHKNNYKPPSNDSSHEIRRKNQIYYPVEDEDGNVDDYGGFKE